MEFIKVGSDFSGVGAFDQALRRLKIDYKTVFACDMDKYTRQTYIHNYGEPEYYPENVYDREIPKDSLDIYMTSPPCQAFSLAGKRKGEDDKRGILFYNSHEFIKVNKPRYFIFENVKGLLSDDGGKTFQRWLDYLGGKSVNGNPVIFPLSESVPYHIYHKVLNAKDFGVPQNRERIFIIGIRDDSDNDFNFPKPIHLEKRLKDVLESEVDEKYYLSDKAVNRIRHNESGFKSEQKDENDIASTVCASDYKITRGMNVLKVNSATKSGYEIATENDSINLSHPNSETRRGRVGKDVAQTLETSCNQGVMIAAMRGRNPDNPSDRTTGAPMQQTLEINKQGTSNTITSVQKDNYVVQKIENWYKKENKEIEVNDIIQTGQTNMKGKRIYKNGISPTLPAENPRSVSVVYTNPVVEFQLTGGKWDKTHEQSGRVYSKDGVSPTIHTMGGGNQEPKIVEQINTSKESGGKQPFQHNRVYKGDIVGTLDTECGRPSYVTGYRIRKLTVRECFRLMDFPDSFSWSVSNSQAYKQAGNSIVVEVLAQIIGKLKLN